MFLLPLLSFCFLSAGQSAFSQEPAKKKPAAAAGKYRQLPVDDSLKTGSSRVRSVLRSGKVAGADKEFLDNYYNKYGFARWSLPANYSRLPGLRKDLVNDFRSSKDQSRAYLNSMSLNFFSKMATVNVHPAVRYNAMLVVASLNSKDAGTRDPAVPLSEALPVLLSSVQDEKQIDAVKVAALRGIWRHAALGITDEQVRNDVIAMASTLAGSKSAPGRTAEGHAWMRRRAIDILGTLGIPGDDSETAKLLAQIVSQESNPLSVRLAAADALGRLQVADDTQVDTKTTALSLGKLALEVCKDFADDLQEEIDRQRRERGFGMGMGGMGAGMGPGAMGPGAMGPGMEGGLMEGMGPGMGGPGMGGPGMGGPGMGGPGMGGPGMTAGGRRPKPEEDDGGIRRRLKARLLDVQTGLTGANSETPGGLAKMAKEDDAKKLVSSILGPVQNWLKLLGDKDLEDEKLVAALERSLNTYGNLLKDASPAAAPVTAPAVEEVPAAAEKPQDADKEKENKKTKEKPDA